MTIYPQRQSVEAFSGANDLAKIQAAVDAVAADGGKFPEIFLARDKLYNCNGILTLRSGVKIFGVGSSTLKDCRILCAGTVGSEVNLTAVVVAGDLVLKFDTTGFSAGDDIWVYGCTNVNSTDAGVDQLGPNLSDYNYFGEHKRIKTVDSAAQVTVEGNMNFPYAITAGANSGSRTCSTVRKVTFAERSGVEGITFTGEFTGTGQGNAFISTTWTKNFRVEDCKFDIGTAPKHCFESINSLDDRFEGNSVKRGAYDATMAALSSRSAYNTAIFRGCITPRAAGNVIDGGYQCMDATYIATLTGVNAPTVDAIFDWNTCRNSRDGATTHWGCHGGTISNNTINSQIGVRLRARKNRAFGNACEGLDNATGSGIYVAGGFNDGTVVSGNNIKRFQYGIEVEGSDTNGAPTIPLSTVVASNTIADCGNGIFVTRNEASNKRLGVLIAANVVTRFTTDGIKIDSYANGVSIEGNKIVGPAGGSARAGIEYLANVTGLSINNNDFIDLGSGIFSLRGPSTASFITDLTTFPSGNAEALLALGANPSFGTDSGVTGVIRDLTAFDSATRSRGFFTQEGKLVARQMNSVTGNVFEVQSSGGSVVAGFDQAGKPRFGTVSAIGAETITGYISLTDAGGAARKIPVVS